MLFNSFSFLIFFPVVAVGFFIVPARYQALWLFLASCYFYMAFVPSYLLVILSVVLLDFFLAPYIERSHGRRRTVFLILSLCGNIGILFLFKYFNFLNINIAALVETLNWNYDPWLIEMALPLGLSFHVFQSLSYIVEVYKGNYPPERNLLTYALYVMFFPQLVAGPIERPAHLLPQLKISHVFDEESVIHGLERMGWGFFKKLVIADNAAIAVNHLYLTANLDGPAIVLLGILFAFQIYCDFSGYSDIAIGSARVLGFSLSENFNRPYAARSISDFWRRWHISLSSWFRDYVYIPLGGNRRGVMRNVFNVFVTLFLSGLWHGAAWTFVLWGMLHGAFLVTERLTLGIRSRVSTFYSHKSWSRAMAFLQIAITFVLVTVGWLIFRASSVEQAFYLLSHSTIGLEKLFDFHYMRYTLLTEMMIGISKSQLVIIFLAILIMEFVQFHMSKQQVSNPFEIVPNHYRIAARYFLICFVMFFGYF
ncbi:MAG: hypothetical protein RIQ56_771, partial [Candidatus Parcubacteria bacterium]